MGLFDGIFSDSKDDKQNPTPVTQTETMPQGTTVTPAAIDELLNISAGNVTPEMPSYTAQKAAQPEASPVIISETPAITETTSPVIISETPAVAPIITETPVATSPIISEVTPTLEANSPIITEVAPAQEKTSPIIMGTPVVTENPVVTPLVSETPAEVTPIMTETPTNPTDLFGGNATDSLSGAEIPATTEVISEEKTETPAITAELPETSLFGAEIPTETKAETPSILGFDAQTEAPAENNIFSEAANETKTETSMPENTEGFIVAGLVQLEKMEKSLAERKQKFLDQADEYRSEKEKFAKLEEEAIKNSRSMDDEQKKIDTMKKYFNKQLEGPNINDSVDTALTGIAVQNAVGKTIEKKTTRKKTAVAA